jgi:hypothetical protein
LALNPGGAEGNGVILHPDLVRRVDRVMGNVETPP